MQLRGHPNINLVVAYMPQAMGYTWEQKAVVYDELNHTLDAIPAQQPLFIGGDFNARLHHRPRDEQEQVGPYVYGRGEHYANSTCEQTQANKELFLSWAKGNTLHVANTWFHKKPSKFITYREVGTHPGHDPNDATKFAQPDFF